MELTVFKDSQRNRENTTLIVVQSYINCHGFELGNDMLNFFNIAGLI